MKKSTLLAIGIVAALSTAAGILLVRRNKVANGIKPPRKAPQVPIQNPGEQSEFTTTASESEIG